LAMSSTKSPMRSWIRCSTALMFTRCPLVCPVGSSGQCHFARGRGGKRGAVGAKW
jgi:hypothetical protein